MAAPQQHRTWLRFQAFFEVQANAPYLNRVKVYVKEVSLCDDSGFISRLPRFLVF